MANIKSAKKRVVVSEKKALQNKMFKSAMKTTIKAFVLHTQKQLRKSTRPFPTEFLRRTPLQEKRADLPVCSTA